MAEYVYIETKNTASNNRQLFKVIRNKEGQIIAYEKVIKFPPRKVIDEEFIDSKIKEANPDFKGTFTDMADIEALENVNANDWAYLVTQDENGNDVYSRYRYAIPEGVTEYEWLFEVAIKRDNFTDEEWAAITSGITPEDVAKIKALPSNAELTEALDGKLDQGDLADVIDSIAIADQTNGDITITYDDGEEEPEENNNQ